MGHIVRGNVVASSPHAAFMGTGNDCLFEHNTLAASLEILDRFAGQLAA